MTTYKSGQTTLPLLVALFLLLGFNYLNANWSAPDDTPPNNNAPAPLNVSATTQTKTGNLIANVFAAGNQMWSDEYCDGSGENCFAPTDVGGDTPPAGTINFGGMYRQTGSCSTGTTKTCSMTSPSCSNVNPITGGCSCPVGFMGMSHTNSNVSCSKNEDSDPLCNPAAPTRFTICYKI